MCDDCASEPAASAEADSARMEMRIPKALPAAFCLGGSGKGVKTGGKQGCLQKRECEARSGFFPCSLLVNFSCCKLISLISVEPATREEIKRDEGLSHTERVLFFDVKQSATDIL